MVRTFNRMHLKAGRAGKGSHLRATELRAERGWVWYIFTAFSFRNFNDSPPPFLPGINVYRPILKLSAEHKKMKICELQHFESFVGRNVTAFVGRNVAVFPLLIFLSMVFR